MAKSREQKRDLYDKYLEGINNSQAIFLVNTSNLAAHQITDIRIKLFEAGAKFAVLKNNVFQKAFEASEIKNLPTETISGPTGVFFISGDVGAVAKVIKEFQKQFEVLESRFGFMDGQLLDKAKIQAIADLPSREDLLAQTVYVIAGPVRNLLGVMNGATRDLVGVLNAIKDQKEA